MSNGRVSSPASARSASSAVIRTHMSSPITPQAMLPCSIQATPPNILRSTMSPRASTSGRIRSARASSYAMREL
jgi:hypothetical protein